MVTPFFKEELGFATLPLNSIESKTFFFLGSIPVSSN
jgi:hypothetical protein